MPTTRTTRGDIAAEWLTARFRECRVWNSTDLHARARLDGISRASLHSIEARSLPIDKRKGMSSQNDNRWRWIAKEGWPE